MKFIGSPHRVFIVLALIFGIAFVCLVKRGDAADEVCHFGRAYQLSQGKFHGEIGKAAHTETEFGPKLHIGVYFQKALLNGNKMDWNVPPDHFEECVNTTNYSPVMYLPQTISLVISRVLKLQSADFVFRLARFFNLIAFTAMVSYAIYLIPFGKWILFLIALLPMTVSLAASASGDTMTNALAFLFLAYILGGNKKHLKWITLTAVSLGLCKMVYAAMLPLLYFYFDRIWEKKYFKNISLTFLVSMLTAGFIYAWSKYILPYYDLYRYDCEVNPGRQLQYVLTNKLTFVKLLIRDYYTKRQEYMREFIGVFGWLTLFMHKASYYIYSRFLISISFLIGVVEKEKIKKELRISMITALMIGCFVLGLVLYLSYTGVGGVDLGLVQGRYFIGFAPLLFLALRLEPVARLQKYQDKLYILIVMMSVGILWEALKTISASH